MKSFQIQLLTLVVMLVAFRAFGEDIVLINNTLISTTPKSQIAVVGEPDRSVTGDLETRVYAQDFFGRPKVNIEVTQLLTSTGKMYLGPSYPFYVDLPEGVIGVSTSGLNIRYDRGFSIADDLLKKGSLAVWAAFEAGSLSSKDVFDSQFLPLPSRMLDVFILADSLSLVKYSIRSVTLKENRVTVELLNTKKTHVGRVTFDASKWPWSITDAWIDDTTIPTAINTSRGR